MVKNHDQNHYAPQPNQMSDESQEYAQDHGHYPPEMAINQSDNMFNKNFDTSNLHGEELNDSRADN